MPTGLKVRSEPKSYDWGDPTLDDTTKYLRHFASQRTVHVNASSLPLLLV